MRRNIAVGFAVVAIAAMAAGLALPGTSGASGAAGLERAVLYIDAAWFENFDRPVLEPGDRAVASAVLRDRQGGARIGTGWADCVVVVRITSDQAGKFMCSWILTLPDGRLSMQGLDRRGPGPAVFAVTGGTDGYATARGVVHARDTQFRDRTVLHFDLA